MQNNIVTQSHNKTSNV